MNDGIRVSAAVFALKPKWADLILDGEKTIEIRRSRMSRMIGRMLVYRTGTGLIVGEVRVKGMHAAMPDVIWRKYGPASGLSKEEFDEYAQGADRLYAYRLESPVRYDRPKTLSEVGLKHAPQPSMDHVPEALRLLTAAADQWELHRFATGDNGDRARAISGMFSKLLAGIDETRDGGGNHGETR